MQGGSSPCSRAVGTRVLPATLLSQLSAPATFQAFRCSSAHFWCKPAGPLTSCRPSQQSCHLSCVLAGPRLTCVPHVFAIGTTPHGSCANVVSSIPGGHVPLRSYLLCLWHQLASRSHGLVGARWLLPPQLVLPTSAQGTVGSLEPSWGTSLQRTETLSLRLSAEPSPLTFLPLDRNLQPWRDPMQCVGSVGKRGW